MSGDDTRDDTTASETGRRGLLKRVVGVGVLLVAGVCGVLGWQFITRPEVADFDVVRGEETNVYTVTVRNNGGPGGVLVMFRLRDENNEVLLRREREITMDGRTERKLEFEVEPPEGTDEYRFEVDPTDFPESIAA